MMKKSTKITYAILLILLSVFGIVICFKFLEIKKHIYDEVLSGLGISFCIFSILIIFLVIGLIKRLIQKDKEILRLEQILKNDNADDEDVIVVKTLKETKQKDIDLLKEIFLNAEKIEGQNIIKNIIQVFDGVKGIYYEFSKNKDLLIGTGYFACSNFDNQVKKRAVDEGIIGQVVSSKKIIYLNSVPPNYVNIVSGLGISKPLSVIIIPFIKKGNIIGIVEVALFTKIDNEIKEIAESIQIVD